MGYIDYETGETPEERRMRLLAEMGSPYLGARPDADLSTGTVDSGGVFGFAPQGFVQQPSSLTGIGASPYMDPGQTPGGSGRDYVDPPPRLGNLFSKPQEPPAPEQDGLLYNGTRSPAGRGVLAQETPDAASPAGPIASPPGLNVTGANGQDRTNAPRSPDEPKTMTPSLPSMAGGLGVGPATQYGINPPRVSVGPTPSAGTGDDEDTAPAKPSSSPSQPGATGAGGLAQPQAAAIADGLSRKPGSPAATNWLADNADLFIAIGAGLLSGKNIGEGIIQGLKLANDQKATSAKQKLEAEKNMAENLKKAGHAALLQKAFNMTPDMALAQSEDADLVKRAQQQLYPDPKDPAWQRSTLPDGTPILENKDTGDRKLDVQAPDKEGFRKATAADVPAGADPARFQVSTKTGRVEPIGGTEPKLSPQDEADKKARELKITGGGTRLNKLAEGRIEAQTGSAMADYAEELLGGIEPGLKTGALAKAAQYGIHLDKNADKVQAAQAVLRRMAALQRTAGGDQSNYELQALEAQVPSLIGTKEGNRAILDTMKAQAKYLDDASRIAAEYQTSPNMRQEEALRRISELPDPFTRMKQYQAERGAAAAPAANPGTTSPVAPGVGAADAAGGAVPMFDRSGRRIR
jgi:hypothetical protein